MSSAAASGPPPVYICVRETLDWHDEAAVMQRLKPEFRPKLQAWNAAFNMPYHVFRQRLAALAQETFNRVRGATVAAAADVPPGAIIVPVDDDDWFSPELAEQLRAAWQPGVLGYYWNRYVLEARPGNPLRWLLAMAGRRDEPDRHDSYLCGTNSYAVVNVEGWSWVMLGHGKATRLFTQHPQQVRRLPATLGIQNRNLSSQTVLNLHKPTISRAKLRRRYERYRRLYERCELQPAVGWAEPYVREMARLMRDLRMV